VKTYLDIARDARMCAIRAAQRGDERMAAMWSAVADSYVAMALAVQGADADAWARALRIAS
jgi:hypothetical protein